MSIEYEWRYTMTPNNLLIKIISTVKIEPSNKENLEYNKKELFHIISLVQ